MRIAFFWTPQFAADILSWLISYPEIEVVLVVSQPDMPVWRKQELLPTPVKYIAIQKGIEVLQPKSLKRERSLEIELNSLHLDFIVVVAYGKIIPKYILDIPKYGCINLHGSILPKYRGASPVQAALKNGESETWLTTMYMSEWMDEGNILKIAKFSIDIIDTSAYIFQKFVTIGPNLLRTTLQDIISWNIIWIPQNENEVTYCWKISKEDGQISFGKQSAKDIYNLYRAYTPWPGIFSYYEGKRFVIEWCFLDTLIFDAEDVVAGSFIYWWTWRAKQYGIVCKDWSILWITQVKLEGKKSMDIVSFVNGNKEILNYSFL